MENPFNRDRDMGDMGDMGEMDIDKDLGTRDAEQQAGDVMDKSSGKAQEAAGDLTSNERWQAEGQAQQMQGDVKEGLGKAEDHLGDVADDLPS